MASAGSLPVSPRSRTSVLVLVALWLGSLWGLLCIPLDLYDECALLLGGRLAREGKLPYLDFYTHYGPLGYDLIAPFLSIGHPGIAYRLAQGLALLLCGALLALLGRKYGAGPRWGTALTVFGYLQLSAAIVYPHFLAYFFVLAALALLALAQAHAPRPTKGYWLGAGACVALAGLVRPAFAAYGVAAVTVFSLLVEGRSFTKLARFLAAVAGAASLTWLLVYRQIPVSEAYLAAVTIPANLSLGSARFVSPALLPPGFSTTAQLVFGGVHLSALFLLATIWAISAPEGKARVASVVGAAMAGLTPVVLLSSRQPGRAASYCLAALFALAAASLAFARRSVRLSSFSRSSALCGLASIAFFHYYLARSDQAHLTASFALAASAALWQAPRLKAGWRAAAIFLLAVAILPFLLGLIPYPLYWVKSGPRGSVASTAKGFWATWPASTFPAEAVAAVAEADRGADPKSRFVAAASDHTRTDGSAIVLFLLSHREPYTKWYAYDPGVQTSPFVQARMVEELEGSGSGTAVVWSAASFGGREPEAGAPPSTPLDRRLRELYPIVVERFGGLTLRSADPGSAPRR